MQLPFFYHHEAALGQETDLDEASARHVVQVLRMGVGDQLLLTNGEGLLWTASITEAGKKRCTVLINKEETLPRPVARRVAIGISPIKNTGRLEWFIEKATELGVAEIYLIQGDRTEKQHLRFERLINISISALLQSRQTWLPRIVPPQSIEKLVQQTNYTCRLIAHCMEGIKHPLGQLLKPDHADAFLLIGPEGDFTDTEVTIAMTYGFKPTSLGNTRLRTETAGVVGAGLLCLG